MGFFKLFFYPDPDAGSGFKFNEVLAVFWQYIGSILDIFGFFFIRIPGIGIPHFLVKIPWDLKSTGLGFFFVGLEIPMKKPPLFLTNQRPAFGEFEVKKF